MPEAPPNEPEPHAARPARGHPCEETSVYTESELRAVLETAEADAPGREDAARPPAIDVLQEDITRLREEVERRRAEAGSLSSRVASLELELETARKDHVTRQSDYDVESQALRSLLERAQGRLSELLAELDGSLRANHALKSQNLELQYQLNLWGIPVTSGEGDAMLPGDDGSFFPRLRSSDPDSDPARPVLRGDLSQFKAPDIVALLGNSGATGVLTILSEGTAVKFYLEGGVLRFAGWNKLDPDLGLAALLVEAGSIGPEMGKELMDAGLSDMETAELLGAEGKAPIAKVRGGLRRLAGRILSYTLGLERGTFLFHGGTLEQHREILFDCPIANAILDAARETDERLQSPARRR